MEFNRWSGMAARVLEDTGLKAFSGKGISVYARQGGPVVLLRSVDGNSYYRDEFGEGDLTCRYTLEGKVGDQNAHSVGNINLLLRATRIFLYRVLANGHYRWLGEYNRDIAPIDRLEHPGEDGVMRRIYRVPLVKK